MFRQIFQKLLCFWPVQNPPVLKIPFLHIVVTFKLQAEINDYDRLKKIGIRVPEMIDADIENERILKEYIDGSTIFELVKSDCMKNEYMEQVKAMCISSQKQ